jgi:hypothetical protein
MSKDRLATSVSPPVIAAAGPEDASAARATGRPPLSERAPWSERRASTERPSALRPATDAPPSSAPRAPSSRAAARDVEPEVKGVSFYNIGESLQRLRGDEAMARFRDRAPASVLALLDSRALVAVGWYPIDWYRALVAAAMEATGDRLELARELGRDATLNDFRGIYRMLCFVVSPEALLKRAQGVFARYRRPGTLIVERAEPGFARVRLEGCTGFDEAMWQVTLGGCMGLLEACGARAITLRIVSGGGDGDASAVGEGRWSTR